MRATATWHKHAPTDDILIHAPAGGGKTTAMRALVSRFESCIASSSWGSSSLWVLKPSAPATAGHVRLSKPSDTLLWYPTARIASAPGDRPLSRWYLESVVEEVSIAKQCVVAIDDIDLFGDTDRAVMAIVDACRNGGCQLVASTRSMPSVTKDIAIVTIPDQ